MKKTKIISAVCAAALSVMTFASCGNADAAETGSADGNAETTTEAHDMNTETAYIPNSDNVKMLGRTYLDGDKLYCALSGTGAEFSFTGTKCTVVVNGDSGCTNASNKDNFARVGIYVNGERVVDDMVDNAVETYDVFSSDTAEDVTVSVVKLSESPMSTIAIDKINVTGSVIKPTENKGTLIEFIGDSITCGYGIDDPNKDHHFVTSTEDVTKTYAYLTAQALDADYSMVSYSGYGIISGYSDGTKKVTEQQVPKYYTKLGYTWTPNGSFVPSNIEWDFGARQPDIIVVNLGTNDDSYTKSKEDRCLEYQEGYVAFLKTIREKNPDAKILCTLGIMGDNLFPYIEAAVKSYTEETGDANVYTMKFDVQNPNDGYSADWHPSVTTHQKASEKLVEEIKKLLA